MNYSNNLKKIIKKKDAVIGLIGMGYVGLPLSILISDKGYKLNCFDKNFKRVKLLKSGKSYFNNISTSPQAALYDISSDHKSTDNITQSDKGKYILLSNFRTTEIILIITIIVLLSHCIFRETYLGKYCNIRCICLKLFNDNNEEDIRRYNNNIHIELQQRDKIEI